MLQSPSHSDAYHAAPEWQQQGRLFHAVNRVATVLLAASEEKFADSLQESMELMGRCVDVDRVLLWQSEMIDGGLYYVNRYQWFDDNACGGIPIPDNTRFFCHVNLEWESKFLRNECINGPLSTLTQRAQDLLCPYAVQSVLLIPLFLQGRFWGIFGFADCQRERTFTEDEIDILHSAGLMIVSAINRTAQAADIRETHKQMVKEIEQRDHLLDIGNRAAAVLLAIEDEKDLDASILKGMELVGRCVDVDRILIRRNEMINGEFYYVKKYEWLNNDDQRIKTPLLKSKMAYHVTHEWESKFLRNECVNGPASTLAKQDQEVLLPFKIKSILVIPLFLQDQFWGVASFGDCRQERTFTEDEVNILRSIGFMLVSTINRAAQAANIREVHERMKLMLDAVPLACHLWDKNFKLFACNKENLHLFKPKNLQYLLDRFYDFSPEYQPDGRLSSEASVAYLRQAFEDGRCVFEWIHQTSDGTPIPTEVTLVRVLYGDDYVVAGYVRDLREHKQMMKEIERRDHLLNIANRAATVLLATEDEKNLETSIMEGLDLIGRCVDVDRVLIWRNEMINGEPCYVRKYEWLNDRDQQIKPYPQNTKIIYRDNIEWQSKFSRNECINGPTSTLAQHNQDLLRPHNIKSFLAIPLYSQDQFWGIASFGDCRQERTFTEDEVNILRSVGLMLVSAVNRGTQAEQLESALAEAREANDTKSDFLAKMSHEMRTPLNAVIGFSELTLNIDGLNEEALSNLENIHNAGTTLLSTVNDILDISKIEAGKLELVPHEYDIPSLINDTITQTILRIEDKPIRFVLDINENLPVRLYGDELRIRQVFNNLLSNAFKYTKEGTVEFGVSCVREGDTVTMTAWVRDTGVGIRAEDLSKLFTNYTQMDQMSNRKIEGTGLGLTITKKLAEMMNGSITVESEYGKGSVFTVTLRQQFVTDTTIGSKLAENLKSMRYSDNKRDQNSRLVRIKLPYARVLVVDDLPMNLEVAKGMLKPYGMHIDCVASGQQAVDAIRKEKVRYNAIFMDHMMPDMDGIEAARIIRQEIGTEYARTIPIIALTANAIVGTEEMFLSKGFQAFISKPIETASLDAVIRQWVQDQKLETQLSNNTAVQPEEIMRLSCPWQLDGVDLQKAWERFGCDEESFLQILRSYAVSTPPFLEKVKEVDEDNLTHYAITVHGIKGSSFGIYADKVGNMAEALETAANVGDIDFVHTNNPAFLEAAFELVANLKDMLDKIAAEKVKPKKDKPDDEVLARLLAACKNYDIDEIDAAMTEIENYVYESDAEIVVWLRENVNQMNYVQIIEQLKNRNSLAECIVCIP